MSFDEDYRSSEQYFGITPEPLLTRHAALLDPEFPVLDIGMGQGRNALWLADRGFCVDGIEPSVVAQETVCEMVAEAGLSVHAYPCGFEEFEAQAEGYGTVLALGLVPLLSPRGLEVFRERVDRWLIPGGVLLITAFTVDDPAYGQIARRWSRVGTHSFIDAGGHRRSYLESGEILRIFEDFQVLHHEEGLGPEHRHGEGPLHRHAIAQAVLRRPAAAAITG
jgi:cyclopropane fatty-acyl-phospholipid synthase-like methyltransferase